MSSYNQEQYEQIIEDVLAFKDDPEKIDLTLMLYIVDTNYSRASISKAIKDLKEDHDINVLEDPDKIQGFDNGEQWQE